MPPSKTTNYVTMTMHSMILVIACILCASASSSTSLHMIPDDGFNSLQQEAAHHTILQPIDATTNIIGGTDASDFEYPFAAAFLLSSRNRARCTGSLIHPYWVLTAAHCNVAVGARIIIGQSDLDQQVDERGMSVQAVAKQVFNHPQYFRQEDGFDIALVRLKYPVHIRPVQIEISDDLTPENEKQTAISVGYGSLGETSDTLSSKLQKITQILHPVCDCIRHGLMSKTGDDPQFSTDDVLSRMVCYVPSNHSARACLGDSGGPLLTTATDFSYKLRGVLNFGTGCRVKLPDYYARVSAYAGWMNSITGDLSSSGANETKFWYAPSEEWSSLLESSPNPDAAANRWCKTRGYFAGVQMRQVIDGGVQCFTDKVVTVLKVQSIGVPIRPRQNILAIRRAANAYARDVMGCAAGIWNGERRAGKLRKLEILCFPLNHPNVFTVHVNKKDLELNELVREELYDIAGLKFARSTGFQAGVWNGDLNDTHVGFVVMGSSYAWDYDDTQVTMQNRYKPQTCKQQRESDCALGMFLLPAQPTTFSDGWDYQYPNSAKRCWIVPSQALNTLTKLTFTDMETEFGTDLIHIYTVDGFSIANRTVEGRSELPLMTLSGQSTEGAEFTAPAVGVTLLVTFESDAGLNGQGFIALVSHSIVRSPCSPLLSRKGCARVKEQCKWFKNACVKRKNVV